MAAQTDPEPTMTFALPNLSHDLTGQVALVTGASSGLGWRFAKTLAACGAKVAVTSRRLDRLETLVGEIEAAGGEAAAFALDVTDAAALVDVVAKAEARFGLVTTLVNNAGIPDAARAHNRLRYAAGLGKESPRACRLVT